MEGGGRPKLGKLEKFEIVLWVTGSAENETCESAAPSAAVGIMPLN